VLDRITKVALVLAFSVSLLMVGGCTKYASQDDENTLSEASQAAVSAEKELAKVVKERKQLEKELSQKESDLSEAKAELENIKTR